MQIADSDPQKQLTFSSPGKKAPFLAAIFEIRSSFAIRLPRRSRAKAGGSSFSPFPFA
jgi:hypothetical protein